MKDSQAEISASRIWRFAVVICAVWTLVITVSFLSSRLQETRIAEEAAVVAARAQFSRDVLYRDWNTSHGGVYVPISEETQPNPLLKVPERDITTPSGRRLTLINPAYMTRQAHELAMAVGNGEGHITSLKPLRAENAADPWETEALEAFESGEKEYVSILTQDGRRIIRLMRPLITKEGCLKCHASQGYEVDDVRGGISVSVPLTPYYALTSASLASLFIGHATVWLLGLTGVCFGTVNLVRQARERDKAIDDLFHEKEFTEAALDAQQDTFFLFELDTGRALRWNRRFSELTGYTDEEIAELKAPDSYYSAQDLELARTTITEILKSGSGSVDLDLVSKDGGRIPFEYSASVINDDQGAPRYLISIGRDITIFRQAEAERAEREAYLGSIVRAAPTGIGVVIDRVLVQANDRLCDMLGYKHSELLGNSARMLYQDDDEFEAAGKKKYQQIAECGTGTVETVWLCKDGTLIDVLLSSTPLDLDDLSNGVTFTALDITERKQAENERKEHIRLLKTLERVDNIIRETSDLSSMLKRVLSIALDVFNSSRTWLLRPDLDAGTFCVPMEVSKPEWPGAGIVQKDLPLHPAIAEVMKRVFADNQAHSFDKDSNKDFESAKDNLMDAQSVLAMALHVKQDKPWIFGLHDCTHPRIWSEDERNLLTAIGRRLTDGLNSMLLFHKLVESEEKYRGLVESTHDWIWEISSDGVFTYCSPQVKTILGYEPEEIVGKNAFELMPVDEREGARAIFNELAAQGKPLIAMENVNLHKDGRPITLDIRAVPLFDNDDRLIGYRGIDRDITERKEAESRLKSELEFTTSAVESLPGLFYVFTVHGKFLRWNRNLVEVAGYSPEEIENMHPLEFFVEEDREKIKHAIQRIFEGAYMEVEARFVYRDGTVRPYNMTGLRTVFNGEQCLVGMGVDLTDRKQAEDERLNLERQVLRAQKLESLGILAGGIAHDFNNLLMAVLGNADLAMLDLPRESPVRKNINEVITAAHRAAGLAKQMLAYSGRGQFVIELVNLNDIAREMVNLLEVSISKKAKLEFDFRPGSPIVEGDSTQIQQILMNLIVNASEAIGSESGEIRLTTGEQECTTEFFETLFPSPTLLGDSSPVPGKYCYVEVADTGQGMDEATLSRIFDPFYTTKFTGRGLGLAATLGIVRGHRGAIHVSSSPGQGTSFRILLPASLPDSAKPARKMESKAERLTGSGTILIADDDASVRQIGEQMLRRAGFEVIHAVDGRAAVETYSRRMSEIKAVLLDLTMPNLDGREAFKEIRRMNPEAKVLLCSGYNESDVCDGFGDASPDGFIQKPFTLSSLLQRLTEILGDEN